MNFLSLLSFGLQHSLPNFSVAAVRVLTVVVVVVVVVSGFLRVQYRLCKGFPCLHHVGNIDNCKRV